MILLVILLGVFQTIMQGLVFYNPLIFLDKKYHIFWFTRGASFVNRKNWIIVLRGKEYKAFSYFPFIMFTDLFHFAHGVFGFLIGELASGSENEDIYRVIYWICGALFYSTAFELSLRLMKYINVKYNGTN